MKIISIFLDDNNNTKLITSDNKEILLELKPFFRIPARCLEIDFENEEQLKAFCIENQTLGF